MLLTVREVARRLNVSLSTVYQLLESSKLGAFHVGPNGGSIRVSEEQLQQYLSDCRSVPREVEERKPPRTKLKHVRL